MINFGCSRLKEHKRGHRGEDRSKFQLLETVKIALQLKANSARTREEGDFPVG